MGYRLDKNLNKKDIRNKKFKHRSLLAAIVFTMSIISNSIIPNTLLVTATENSKFDVYIDKVDDNVKSEDNIFELSKKAEKNEDGNINVTLEVKVNKDNIPSKNEEIEVEEVNEEKLNISPEVNKIDINEKITEEFEINKDSIKIEAIENGEAVELNLEELKNNKLLNEDLEKNLKLTLSKVTSDIIKISYLINTNSNLKAGANIKLSEEAELKYYLLDNEKEKKVLIPNILVDIKEIQLEQENEEIATVEEPVIIEELVSEITDEEKESTDKAVEEEKETAQDDNNEDSVESDSTVDRDEVSFGNTTALIPNDIIISNGVALKGVAWSRTPEPKKYENAIEIKNNNNYLYNNKRYTLVDDINYSENKVIATNRKLRDNNRIIFEYGTLTTLLNPTETNNVWDGKTNNEYYSGYSNKIPGNYSTTFATWKDYRDGDSYRLFRGEFNIEDISNKSLYVGVTNNGDNPQLIMPINDFMVVMVDGNLTDINFATAKIANETLGIKKGESISFPQFTQAYHCTPGYDGPYCSDENHKAASLHTDTWHIHLKEDSASQEGIRLGDITKYLDSSKSEHKIEVLCGDYATGGGISKLDLFLVDNANIEVKKSGFLMNGENETDIVSTTQVNEGDTIYYKFMMTNTGNSALDNVEFIDELVGVEINSSGVFNLKGEQLDNSLKVQKGIVNGDGKFESSNEVESGTNALKLLTNLQKGETILIKDTINLKHLVVEEDFKENQTEGEIENIVIGTGRYFNNQLYVTDTDKFKTIISKNKVDIKLSKEVNTVYRKGKEEYKKGDNKSVPELLPGDKVTFIFTIKNESTGVDNKKIAISNLNLKDVFSGYYEEYSPKLTFECDSINNFNATNFTIEANQSITVTTSEWTVPEPYTSNDDGTVTIWDYNITNTVILSKGSWNKSSSVDLKIQPPSLEVKKVIASDSLSDLNNDRTFTIMVKGSDRTQYNIEAEASIDDKEKVYTLNNLKYGVTYTISEIVPMNYELVSINGGTDSSNNTDTMKDKITLTGANNNPLVTITNKKVNDSFWTDESKCTNVYKFIENILKYIEEGV